MGDGRWVSKAGDTLTGPLYASAGSSFAVYPPTSGGSAVGVTAYKSDKTTVAGGAGVLFSGSGTSISWPWYKLFSRWPLR